MGTKPKVELELSKTRRRISEASTVQRWGTCGDFSLEIHSIRGTFYVPGSIAVSLSHHRSSLRTSGVLRL